MNESLEYASIIGMLMYLANNTRLDIAHAAIRIQHPPSHVLDILFCIKDALRSRSQRCKPIVLCQQWKANI